MKQLKPLRLSMQYFAEPAPQGDEPPKGETPPSTAPTTTNYEELFKTDTNLQAFIGKQVQTATTAALEKERILNDEKATEAEKLAKMNKEEKQAYEMKKLQNQLEQYKTAENVRKLRDEALKTAEEKKIPTSLVDMIPFAHIKAEDVATKLDALKTAYDTAVKEGVAQALDGAGTPKGGGSSEKVNTGLGSFMKIIEENQAKR